MNRVSTIVMLVIVSPYLVSFVQVAPDSSFTEVGFALGTGSYAEVTRDCNGNVTSIEKVPFREAAVSIDHYAYAVHFGLRSGVVGEGPAAKIFTRSENWTYGYGPASSIPNGSVFYATPIVGLNTTYFGLDLGYVFPIREDMAGVPAGSLRIGNKDAFHFRARLADQLPLITGGTGIGSMGFAWNLGKPRQTMWMGLGALPYDGLLVGSQLELPLSDMVLLRLAGSVGFGEATEYGVSAGTRIRL